MTFCCFELFCYPSYISLDILKEKFLETLHLSSSNFGCNLCLLSCNASLFMAICVGYFIHKFFLSVFSPIFSNMRKQSQRRIKESVIHLKWSVLRKKSIAMLQWSQFLVTLTTGKNVSDKF